MSSPSMSDTKLNTREIAELSILSALTFAGKLALAFIPNVHPVALMIICVTIIYGAKAFYMAAVYVALEILVYGFGIWSISYIYIWPLLVVAALIFRKEQSRWIWALIAGLHGLLFGALCSIPYIFAGGFSAGLAYWVAGIPFDLIHGASNAVLTFFLLNPLIKALEYLKSKI